MFQLDYRDSRPLYLQIKEKAKKLVIKGVLKPDEKMPSVRELAQQLTVNPNTIQKAYKDLEDEGFIYSLRGKGNFVAPRDYALDSGGLDKLMKELEKNLTELIYLGADRQEILFMVNKLYNEKEACPEDDTSEKSE